MDDAAYNLRPYWWLKRLSAAFVLLLLITLGLRLYWGWHWNRELQQHIDAIAAKGEPIRFEDVQFEHVPDEQKKLTYVLRALAQWATVEADVADGYRHWQPGDERPEPDMQRVLITESNWYNYHNDAPDIPDAPFLLADSTHATTDPRHERHNYWFVTLGYIDNQHLAPRIRSRVLMATGLMDTVCPPSTQFAAYNKITSEKDMVLYPDFGHEALPAWYDQVFQYMLEM